MSMKTKRVEVTVDTDEVLVIRRPAVAILAWCGKCSAQVRMITVDQAAAAAGVSPRVIFRRLEAGRIHFTETVDDVLICANSI
jgi:hypothetical protein